MPVEFIAAAVFDVDAFPSAFQLLLFPIARVIVAADGAFD